MWDGCVGIVLVFEKKKQRTPSCAQEGDLVKFTPVWRTGSSVGQSGGLIIPWSWVQVPPGPPTANRLLHDNLPRFVVPWLPHANDCAVRLNLINVCAGNPDLLRRIDRRRHYRRGHHGSRDNRSCDDARADDRISQDATDNPSDKPRPKMTPPASPRTVVVMVHRGRRRAMMQHGRRPPAKATMMAKAAARTAKARASHKRSCRQDRAKCKYKFLVHFVFPFSAFCGHVKIGHESRKN